MAGIELKNIKKSFGDKNQVEVIKNIDLDIKDGEFVVFVGPSGCGKSTLLRLIAGLETPTAGQVFIGGKDVTNHSPLERGIAMVFQSYALYPHMNVYDNMAFALKLASRPKEEIDVAVRAAAKTLNIDHLLNRKPKELSGGQRQRVAIGRAIVRKPEVFLFDEPLSNLDAALRVKMRYEFARLGETLGKTIIYVTHDQIEAMTLADKIVVLNNGYISQYGAPLELYKRPENIFVAGFIGSPKMNSIKAKVINTNAKEAQILINNHSEITIKINSDLRIGDDVTVGIRPEHLFISENKGLLDAKLQFVEELGHAKYAYFETADDKDSEVKITLQLAPEFNAKIGKNHSLSFDLSHIHVFNKDGKNVTLF
ncbi:ABC transporter ATP-binding protein [Pseudaquidulcibacter saccharophilus]|uniref:ABC transporter ATP-binding protein n=1 Tax=Pseudaquidulcibacter saccharophilus TaxID=2831900 RepID=UPI001EFF5534|nr:ABC transporter ATP-binding protein [Pseudaquidulcibacter saccharophilus]